MNLFFLQLIYTSGLKVHRDSGNKEQFFLVDSPAQSREKAVCFKMCGATMQTLMLQLDTRNLKRDSIAQNIHREGKPREKCNFILQKCSDGPACRIQICCTKEKDKLFKLPHQNPDFDVHY